MEAHGCCWRSLHPNFFHSSQPYILSIFASVCYAGLNYASMVSLDKGMSAYVLVAYGDALATLVTAAFVLAFERMNRPKMNMMILMEVFLLGLLGAVLARTLYYTGLERTSSTFASVMSNLFPSMTFLLAIIFRMEKLEMRKITSQAKVVGTVVALGGAMLMTLYKGIIVISMSSRHPHHSTARTASSSSVDKDWINGSLMLIGSALTRSGSSVLQARTIKKYPAPISLTCLTSLFGTFQAMVLSFAIERKASVWKLGWDLRLLSISYSGIMVFGVATYIQFLVIRKRGPVFAAVFNPLSTVIVALADLLVLRQSLHMGSMVGAILIILGLYMVLWAKNKENKKEMSLDEEFCQDTSSNPPNTNQDPKHVVKEQEAW
ncbi:WAT1-related protein At5g07050-like isoform X2 [Magnolia sinica]|uniref:WAT1-related protein At5g07050-like isoform X2 n=1 Tax=Magnolia sinica TaxID=86752 RepID=UPI00265A8F98|nr:WAT1-related protein At5g07050-like isoform X2 [Magnolia sinica]